MDNESVDKNYQKGFNHGYWLAADDGNGKQYLDELVKGIKDKDSSYYKALLAGKKQHEKDKFIEEIKQTKEQSKDKEQDR